MPGGVACGIAHEKPNALNFVNNFAAIHSELLSEMKELLTRENLSAKEKKEIDLLTDHVIQNLHKITPHDKRAGSSCKIQDAPD